MPELRVLKEYRHRSTFYQEGDVIEVDEDQAERLMAAKPDTFEVVKAGSRKDHEKADGQSSKGESKPQG